ncbi:MAG: hypothetical protein M3256_08835, partial [Actinomycetota bacterium]|nr:hypothetical protein [Actinomycetota bacterium]
RPGGRGRSRPPNPMHVALRARASGYLAPGGTNPSTGAVCGASRRSAPPLAAHQPRHGQLSLLLMAGTEILADNLRQARLTEPELWSQLRRAGVARRGRIDYLPNRAGDRSPPRRGGWPTAETLHGTTVGSDSEAGSRCRGPASGAGAEKSGGRRAAVDRG